MPLPIGGFMPIPLAMMIPFMAVQSIVMGDAFGMAYQYGKRKISSMTNENFNKLELSDLIAKMQQEFKNSIPSIKQSITDSSDLQNRIINEMLLILPKFATQKGFTDAGAETGKVIAETLAPLTTQNITKTEIEYKGILETFLITLAKNITSIQVLPAAYPDTGDGTTIDTNIVQGPTEGPPEPTAFDQLQQTITNLNKPNIKKQQAEDQELKVTATVVRGEVLADFTYFEKIGARGVKNVRVVIKGNAVLHRRTLQKWRSSFNSGRLTGYALTSLGNKIAKYVRVLQGKYPELGVKYWF